MDTGRNAAAFNFSNSVPVGCKVVGRYALESASARYWFVPRSYCNHTLKVFCRARTRETSSGWIAAALVAVALDFHVASVGALVKFLK